MSETTIYRYTRSRRQKAIKLLLAALVCWGYIGAGLFYESMSGKLLPADLKLWSGIGFGIASVVLLLASLWCFRHPGEYLAEVTNERFRVQHPGWDGWCFDVAIAEIRRFEYRQSHGPGGEGVMQHGALLHNGEFHHVNQNYGVDLKKLYNAVRQVNPDVSFLSTLNRRFAGGPIERDYRD